jgi:hypothetical protein
MVEFLDIKIGKIMMQIAMASPLEINDLIVS